MFHRIHQVAPICPHGKVHWHNVANTIELSICGGDAALCQITLTTWLVQMEWRPEVYIPLHHKVQKFSSGTGSPEWSQKKGRKMVVCAVCCYFC